MVDSMSQTKETEQPRSVRAENSGSTTELDGLLSSQDVQEFDTGDARLPTSQVAMPETDHRGGVDGLIDETHTPSGVGGPFESTFDWSCVFRSDKIDCQDPHLDAMESFEGVHIDFHFTSEFEQSDTSEYVTDECGDADRCPDSAQSGRCRRSLEPRQVLEKDFAEVGVDATPDPGYEAYQDLEMYNVAYEAPTVSNFPSPGNILTSLLTFVFMFCQPLRVGSEIRPQHLACADETSHTERYDSLEANMATFINTSFFRQGDASFHHSSDGQAIHAPRVLTPCSELLADVDDAVLEHSLIDINDSIQRDSYQQANLTTMRTRRKTTSGPTIEQPADTETATTTPDDRTSGEYDFAMARQTNFTQIIARTGKVPTHNFGPLMKFRPTSMRTPAPPTEYIENYVAFLEQLVERRRMHNQTAAAPWHPYRMLTPRPWTGHDDEPSPEYSSPYQHWAPVRGGSVEQSQASDPYELARCSQDSFSSDRTVCNDINAYQENPFIEPAAYPPVSAEFVVPSNDLTQQAGVVAAPMCPLSSEPMRQGTCTASISDAQFMLGTPFMLPTPFDAQTQFAPQPLLMSQAGPIPQPQPMLGHGLEDGLDLAKVDRRRAGSIPSPKDPSEAEGTHRIKLAGSPRRTSAKKRPVKDLQHESDIKLAGTKRVKVERAEQIGHVEKALLRPRVMTVTQRDEEDNRTERERKERERARRVKATMPIKIEGYLDGDKEIPPSAWDNGQVELVRRYPNHLHGAVLKKLTDLGWTPRRLSDLAGDPAPGKIKITRNAMHRRVAKLLGTSRAAQGDGKV